MRVKQKDIRQGSRGSCVLLAVAIDNLTYRLVKNTTVLTFHDRLTGAPEHIRVQRKIGQNASRSTAIIERGYGKWLQREGIYDETGATGLEAVSNGNMADAVIFDVTGKDAVMCNIADASWYVTQQVVTTPTLFPFHAYTVLGHSTLTTKLFNPWGFNVDVPNEALATGLVLTTRG